jgi:hypothetical protein
MMAIMNLITAFSFPYLTNTALAYPIRGNHGAQGRKPSKIT